MKTNQPSNYFWDQLLQLIAEGHVIPIIGQELLAVEYHGRQCLLQQLLAELLAEYFGMQAGDLQDGHELNSVICRYIDEGNRLEDVYPALMRIMPDRKDLSIPEPLSKLAAITPFNLFVSTTFDPLLEWAVNETRYGGKPLTRVLSYAPNDAQDISPGVRQADRATIYHLLGKISSLPMYAVTQEDTLEFVHALQSEARNPQRLFDELNRANLLILGCNYSDWLARFFLRTAKRKRLIELRGNTDFIVDSSLRVDGRQMQFFHHFSAQTKIFPEGSAADFVEELHARWQDRAPAVAESASVLDGVEEGCVFLSYASEDLPAALAIKHALEEDGIDVFFDKNHLEGGDAYEEKIARHIHRCSVFVPVVSRHTLTEERRFFRREWRYACREALDAPPGARFIIPICLDDTSPNAAQMIEDFSKLHWERMEGTVPSSRFASAVKTEYRAFQRRRSGTT
jgi:hypothetical protein